MIHVCRLMPLIALLFHIFNSLCKHLQLFYEFCIRIGLSVSLIKLLFEYLLQASFALLKFLDLVNQFSLLCLQIVNDPLDALNLLYIGDCLLLHCVIVLS